MNLKNEQELWKRYIEKLNLTDSNKEFINKISENIGLKDDPDSKDDLGDILMYLWILKYNKLTVKELIEVCSHIDKKWDKLIGLMNKDEKSVIEFDKKYESYQNDIEK